MFAVTTLLAVVCVGLTRAATDIEFDLVIQHIDLLKSQVQLLKSRKLTVSSSLLG